MITTLFDESNPVKIKTTGNHIQIKTQFNGWGGFGRRVTGISETRSANHQTTTGGLLYGDHEIGELAFDGVRYHWSGGEEYEPSQILDSLHDRNLISETQLRQKIPFQEFLNEIQAILFQNRVPYSVFTREPGQSLLTRSEKALIYFNGQSINYELSQPVNPIYPNHERAEEFIRRTISNRDV